MAKPRTIAGLNPLLETSALEASTPTREAENCTRENRPARLSSSPHLAMKIGRIGAMKGMTMPLTTKPPQSRTKIVVCGELRRTSGVCVSVGIMAFCRSRRPGAIAREPVRKGSASAMIEVGLIGFGLGGKAFHAPVIAAVKGLRLAAVLQRHEQTAAEIYPGVKVVRTVEEMLAIPSIRLVAISTPNDSHFAYVKACLEAERDVVVDKPFTTTLAEAKELAQLARKRGRLLTVYQERRLDGDFATLKKLIADGLLGRLVHCEETFDRCRAEVRDS